MTRPTVEPHERAKPKRGNATGGRCALARLLLLLVPCCTCLGACTLGTYEPPPWNVDVPIPASLPLHQAEAWSHETSKETSPDEPTAPSPARRTDALHLDEVLDSVTSRYPPFLSALLERDIAGGRLETALGEFDTDLKAKAGHNGPGYYEYSKGELSLELPLPTGGELFAGYRMSRDLLPDYYHEIRTQRGGEFALGGRFPLLRDRAMDARRLKLRQAEIDQALADPEIAKARIEFVLGATVAYYEWITAGRRLNVAQDLLALATGRVEGIGKAVEKQFLAEIDVTDNERLVVQRRVLVTRAQRELERAALALSLYLRDVNDDPIVPDAGRLPAEFPAIEPPNLEAFGSDVATAILHRPELRQFQLLHDRTTTDRKLAENQTLPQLDVVVDASKNVNQQPYKDRNEFELFLGLEFKLPIQRRKALGRLREAETRLQRLRIQSEFARDRVVNEVANALSALRATHAQLDQAERNIELARELVDAERRAFELGRSDLLRINLREIALADARLLRLDALRGYFLARARYRAALGVDAEPEFARR